jgi:hypothetical protein
METEPFTVAGFSKMSGVTSEPMTGESLRRQIERELERRERRDVDAAEADRGVGERERDRRVVVGRRVERARARGERIEIRADDAELDDAHPVGLPRDLDRGDAAADALLGEVDVLIVLLEREGAAHRHGGCTIFFAIVSVYVVRGVASTVERLRDGERERGDAVTRRLRLLFAAGPPVAFRRTTSPTRTPSVIHEPAARTIVPGGPAVAVTDVPVACVRTTAAWIVPRMPASISLSNVPTERSPA